jgi:hypothetical protein
MIQRGQIYRSADPRDGDVRIQVVGGYARNYRGGSSVTIATIRNHDGKLIRQRSILAAGLHESPVTKTGATRRTGWVLVEGADGGNADA